MGCSGWRGRGKGDTPGVGVVLYMEPSHWAYDGGGGERGGVKLG